MLKEIIWIDKHDREYTASELTDSHLTNILKYILRGGGYDWFVTMNTVVLLHREARRRGLKTGVTFFELSEEVERRERANRDYMILEKDEWEWFGA